jgi:hypothetical protein
MCADGGYRAGASAAARDGRMSASSRSIRARSAPCVPTWAGGMRGGGGGGFQASFGHRSRWKNIVRRPVPAGCDAMKPSRRALASCAITRSCLASFGQPRIWSLPRLLASPPDRLQHPVHSCRTSSSEPSAGGAPGDCLPCAVIPPTPPLHAMEGPDMRPSVFVTTLSRPEPPFIACGPSGQPAFATCAPRACADVCRFVDGAGCRPPSLCRPVESAPAEAPWPPPIESYRIAPHSRTGPPRVDNHPCFHPILHEACRGRAS